MTVFLFIHLFIYLFIIYLFIYLSIYYLFIYLFICSYISRFFLVIAQTLRKLWFVLGAHFFIFDEHLWTRGDRF